MSDAAKELKLLEAVELKVALPDTAAKLEAVLKVYLCPALLKLNSPHEAVRQKTIGLCQVISRRLDNLPEVTLPLDALIRQYQSNDASRILRTVVLSYISIAVERSKAPLIHLAELFRDAHTRETEETDALSRIVVKMLLAHEKLDRRAAETLGTPLAPADQVPLGVIVGKLLLHGQLHVKQVLRGTTETAEGVTATELRTIRTNTLHLLGTELLSNDRRSVYALLATYNRDDQVRRLAEEVCRLYSRIDVEEALTIDLLYAAVSGIMRRLEQARIDPELSPALAVKLLQLLSRSRLATTRIDNAVATYEKGIRSTHPRIRSAAIGLLHALARSARTHGFDLDSTRLIGTILDFVDQADEASKKLAFVSTGLLLADSAAAKSSPEIMTALLRLLEGSTDSETSAAIEKALSSMTFRFAPDQQASAAKAMWQTSSTSARTTVQIVKLAVRSFPYSDCVARVSSLLRLEDATPEVAAEITISLDPYKFRLSNRMYDVDRADPSFYAFANSETLLQSFDDYPELFSSEVSRAAAYDLLRTHVYREVLAADWLADATVLKEDWRESLDAKVQYDLPTRAALESVSSHAAILHKIVPQLLTDVLVNRSASAAKWLLELTLLGNVLGSVPDLAHRIDELLALSQSTEDVAEAASSILAASLYDRAVPQETVGTVLAALSSTAAITLPARLAKVRLFLAAYRHARSRLAQPHDGASLSGIRQLVHEGLDSKNLHVLRSAIDCYGELGLAGLVDDAAKLVSVAELLFKSQSTQLLEASLTAIGYAAAYTTLSDAQLQRLLDAVVSLDAKDSLDVSLAAGEALSAVFAGSESQAIQRLARNMPESNVERDAALDAFLVQLLSRRINSPKRSSRKAAAVQLLTLLQYLPASATLQKHLLSMHKGFMSVMADTDEFVSDAATQGIQLVYSRADQSVREQLVSGLFSIFTSDDRARSAQGRVTADSELFDSAATVGKNKKVSTFRDICDLAQDMGNSSMVYQFLSLSSSANMWSTRRGVALGLKGALGDRARETLLKGDASATRRLLPKLFVYKHDPAKSIADSMSTIHDQLFDDAALTANFDVVLTDLLSGINGQSERRRESCCSAMITLLRGRIEKADRLDEIWQKAVRVLDDQKESVRSAAITLCKFLTKELMKTLDSKSDGMLGTILPLLFANLKSPSQDVALFALDTILQISKRSATPLQPYLPVLIEELLVMTTSMEPEMLNYLSFHAAKYNITQSQLDEARVSGVNMSPVLASIEECVDRLTAASMEETVSRLATVIRQSQGLPTKAACARTIIAMVSRKPTLLQPHADKLLQALSGALTDANETGRSAYGAAAGYVSRLCTEQKLGKLVVFLQKKYFEGSDDGHEIRLLANLCQGVATHANERFKAMASTFMPLVYFGMHDADDGNRKRFRDLWEANTGSAASVKQFLPQVVDLVKLHLGSPRWRVKRAAAATLAAAAKAIDLGDATDEALELAVGALQGRSWAGKEEVLHAIVSIAKRAPLDAERKTKLALLLVKEAKRKAADYRRHALTHLATLLESSPEVDVFTSVYDGVKGLLLPENVDEDAMDVDDVDERQLGPLKLVLVQRAVACLAAGFRSSTDLDLFIDTYIKVQQQGLAWNVKLELCKGVGAAFKCKIGISEPQLRRMWQELLRPLLTDSSYPTLREEAGRAAAQVADTARNGSTPVAAACRTELQDDMDAVVDGESNTVVKGVLRKVRFV